MASGEITVKNPKRPPPSGLKNRLERVVHFHVCNSPIAKSLVGASTGQTHGGPNSTQMRQVPDHRRAPRIWLGWNTDWRLLWCPACREFNRAEFEKSSANNVQKIPVQAQGCQILGPQAGRYSLLKLLASQHCGDIIFPARSTLATIGRKMATRPQLSVHTPPEMRARVPQGVLRQVDERAAEKERGPEVRGLPERPVPVGAEAGPSSGRLQGLHRRAGEGLGACVCKFGRAVVEICSIDEGQAEILEGPHAPLSGLSKLVFASLLKEERRVVDDG